MAREEKTASHSSNLASLSRTKQSDLIEWSSSSHAMALHHFLTASQHLSQHKTFGLFFKTIICRDPLAAYSPGCDCFPLLHRLDRLVMFVLCLSMRRNIWVRCSTFLLSTYYCFGILTLRTSEHMFYCVICKKKKTVIWRNNMKSCPYACFVSKYTDWILMKFDNLV